MFHVKHPKILTESQRAMRAADEFMRPLPSRMPGDPKHRSRTSRIKDIAATWAVSPRNIEYAMYLMRNGTDAKIKAVRAGKMTIHAASDGLYGKPPAPKDAPVKLLLTDSNGIEFRAFVRWEKNNEKDCVGRIEGMFPYSWADPAA